MARKNLVAANWKMNKTIADSEAFVTELKSGLGGVGNCDLLVFPPFFSLPRVSAMLRGTGVATGAQDVFWEERGAYTGEISCEMIRDAGGTYGLVGHSERRHVIGENDEIINKKLRAVLNGGLLPILCVGEQIEHRESGGHESVVRGQLDAALSGLSGEEIARVVIAYEPVWAIGTGKTATPADAVNMHVFIRGWIRDSFGDAAAESLRIQYGGSVKPSNAAELLGEEEIDGALIGGAGLEAQSFLAIASALR